MIAEWITELEGGKNKGSISLLPTRELDVEHEAAALDEARDVGARGECRVDDARLQDVGHLAQAQAPRARHHRRALGQRAQLEALELGGNRDQLVLGLEDEFS